MKIPELCKVGLKLFLFSFLLTGSLGLFLLPYGFFALPILMGLAYYLFFIPTFISSLLMYATVRYFKKSCLIKVYGSILSVGTFVYSALIIREERGSSEYLGNHWMTYSQLAIAAILGFFAWNFLAKKILFAVKDPHKLYSYRD